ncbi:hypothetical protein LCGC14_0144230 [marine sediment metagenome]|uniref:Uncharacterized protein n=1 Tax=marine sediment metagenome TaxID=412755 RepID=A0A0F9Y257_9ZZZZ
MSQVDPHKSENYLRHSWATRARDDQKVPPCKSLSTSFLRRRESSILNQSQQTMDPRLRGDDKGGACPTVCLHPAFAGMTEHETGNDQYGAGIHTLTSFLRRRESSILNQSQQPMDPRLRGDDKGGACPTVCLHPAFAKTTDYETGNDQYGAGIHTLTSFPRKRESSILNQSRSPWIPAFAGMTEHETGNDQYGAGIHTLTSFPRRRESSILNQSRSPWLPAFAGMTNEGRG